RSERVRGARRPRRAAGDDRRPLAGLRPRRGAHDQAPRAARAAEARRAPARARAGREGLLPGSRRGAPRMAALSLQGVSFRYPRGEEDVLRDVSLDIGSGGVLGLLGPNGAGKTTLISILAGQLRGASGRVRVDGSLGLVPQELAFYPMLTCRENLRFFGAVQGLQGGRLSQRIAAVAGLARIEAVLARRAGELSGGLKRRLNLAIGLLTAPEI